MRGYESLLTKVPSSCQRSTGKQGTLGPQVYPWKHREKALNQNRNSQIGSKWDRTHLDPIHFLRGVYTGSDPELFAFTRDQIHLDFMDSQQSSRKPFLLS